jgi:hypothetical protein
MISVSKTELAYRDILLLALDEHISEQWVIIKYIDKSRNFFH